MQPFRGQKVLARSVPREDMYAALARRAAEGSEPALRELLRRLTVPLRRVVRDVLGPGGDADDCLQEALVAVTHGLASFRGDCTFLHFAVRIAIRCAASTRRRSRLVRASSDRMIDL